MRNPSKFLNSIIAHKGPIFCMDWHPDPTRSTIVTGGRDKTLKVSKLIIFWFCSF